MKGIETHQLIAELKEITQANIDFVNKKCIHLGENQLEWRPTQNSWSIQDVLSHLLANSNYYHPQFLLKIRRKKSTNPKEVFVSSPLGRSAWRSMKLGKANNIKRKFRAPKDIDPLITPSIIDQNAVENFVLSQEEMLRILDKAVKVNLKRIRIRVSISKITRFRLGDALMFVIYHSERHMQQIQNILGQKGFPKKKKRQQIE